MEDDSKLLGPWKHFFGSELRTSAVLAKAEQPELQFAGCQESALMQAVVFATEAESILNLLFKDSQP